MFRSTISTIKKALVFTFVPHIWRGHVKQVAKEKLPGLLSSVQKSSNSDSQDGKERCEKCMRIINYSFGDGEYPASDISGFKVPDVDKEQVALAASQLHTDSGQSNDKTIQKNIESILNTNVSHEKKHEQEYFEQQVYYSTMDKSTDHTDHTDESKGTNKIEKIEEPSIVVKPEEPIPEPHILSDRDDDYHYCNQFSGPLNNTSKSLKAMDDEAKIAEVLQSYFPKTKVMTLFPHSNIGGVTSLFDCSHPAVKRRSEISPTAMIDKELFEEVESQTMPPDLHQWASDPPVQNTAGDRPTHPADNTDYDVNARPIQYHYLKPQNIHPAFFFYSPISTKSGKDEATKNDPNKAAFQYSKTKTLTDEPKIPNLDQLDNPNLRMGATQIDKSRLNHEAAKPFLMNDKPLDYEAAVKDSINDKVPPPERSEEFVLKSNAANCITPATESKDKCVEEGPVIDSETLSSPLQRNDSIWVNVTDTKKDIKQFDTMPLHKQETLEKIKTVSQPDLNFTMAFINKVKPRENALGSGVSEGIAEKAATPSQFVKPEVLEEGEKPATVEELEKPGKVEEFQKQKPELVEDVLNQKSVLDKDFEKSGVEEDQNEKLALVKEVQIQKSTTAEKLEKPVILEDIDNQKSTMAEELEKPEMVEKIQIQNSTLAEELEKPPKIEEVQNQNPAIAEEAHIKKSAKAEQLEKPAVAEEVQNKKPVIAEELEKPETVEKVQIEKAALAEELEKPAITEEIEKPGVIEKGQDQSTAQIEELEKPATAAPVQMPVKEFQANTQKADLAEDIQITRESPATIEETQVQSPSTEAQEAPRTEADEISVLNSYAPPTSEKVQTNISANVGPLPLISHTEIETMRLSEVLRIVQTRNRMQACKEFELGIASMVGEKTMSKCPKPPCCPPPSPCCPPPSPPPCPPPPPPPCPKPPKCPPPPPPCPPPPPPCPKPNPCPPACPKPNPCPPKKKDPCKRKNPCPPKKICCVGCPEDMKGTQMPRLILRPLSSAAITIREIPTAAIKANGVLQPFYKEISSKNSLSILFARSFDPWTPIPSWPIPKKAEKRVVLCPKDGCPFPKPPKDGEFCKPREKPCKGFPRRLTCSGIIDPYVLDSVLKYAYFVIN